MQLVSAEDEALAEQNGLPPHALRTVLRALQRFVLAQLGAGRGVSIHHIGRLVFITSSTSTGTGPHAQERQQLVFEASDGLTRGLALRLGRGVARGLGAAAACSVVEEVNHTQLALRWVSRRDPGLPASPVAALLMGGPRSVCFTRI
jgi:hypothetical protein